MQSKFGSLAQLVQSICLTSRGSGVRTPQLPQEILNESWGFFIYNDLGEKSVANTNHILNHCEQPYFGTNNLSLIRSPIMHPAINAIPNKEVEK